MLPERPSPRGSRDVRACSSSKLALSWEQVLQSEWSQLCPPRAPVGRQAAAEQTGHGMIHRPPRDRHRPTLLSFSGIDGAGKSTQIEILIARLRQAGLRVGLLAFWDDVAVLTRFRGFTSHTVFGGDKGVGAPDRPVSRRDKNVQSWYMTPLRALLYFLDALSLRGAVAEARTAEADVIIFDRYLYDELANLPQDHPVTRAYVRLLLKLSAPPDLAYLIDAYPVQARARKPEYPIEFLRSNRAAYLALSEMAGMTVVAPGSVGEISDKIMQTLSENIKTAVVQPEKTNASSFQPNVTLSEGTASPPRGGDLAEVPHNCIAAGNTAFSTGQSGKTLESQ
jgi:thymidylate kinase